MSWFSYRYWWFVWIMFTLILLLFLVYCPRDSAFCNTDELTSRIAEIDNNLDSCCTCSSLGSKAIDCPDRELVFQVCNSNQAIDDNFRVFLNGVEIGLLDLNSNDLVGSVFIASKDHSVKISDADFVCPLDKIKAFYFDPSIVRFGNNTIEMKNIQNNGNNNEGTIGIRNYLLKNSELISPCFVQDISYNMSSGEDFTISFNYTKCCEK